MSGIVAVTLLPIMSAYVAPERGREGPFTRMVGRVFDRLRDGYGVVLDIVLRFRAQVRAFGAFICVLAVPLYMFSSKELAPVEDQAVVFVLMTSAPDATLAYTAGHMDKVYQTGTALPELQAMFEPLPLGPFRSVLRLDEVVLYSRACLSRFFTNSERTMSIHCWTPSLVLP